MNYNIIKNGKTFEATGEQIDIFKFVESGVGNGVIVAAAGSAKTSTIENALRFIPSDKKVLFIAFNKDVCDEIRKDLGDGYENVDVKTFHSLGYTILRKCSGRNDFIVYEHKYKKYINDNINTLTQYKETESLGLLKNRYIKNIIRLIEYARYYCVMRPKDIKSLINIYSDIQIIRDEHEVVYEVLKWGQNNISTIDNTDMIWVPYIQNMMPPFLKYDFIFIDEAQDITIAQERLIEKVKGRGCRVIAVGDEKQRINVWCGASSKAFNNFKIAPNTSLFHLTTSFRLPKVGETFIHQKFPDIEIHSSKNAIEGKINYDVSLSMVRPYSMVLCRNTTPMFKSMLDVMRMNKKCYLKGWEHEQEVFQNIVKSHADAIFIDSNLDFSNGLFTLLYKELFSMIDNLTLKDGLTREEALSNDGVFNFLDQIMSLEVLSEGLITVEELLNKLNMIFEKTNDPKDAILFSTVHRSKGLEADHVFILYPSLLPSPFAEAEWEIEAEENLRYVAYTRFKKSLNFIEEDNTNNKFRLFNKSNFIAKLNDVQFKITQNSNEDTYRPFFEKPLKRPIVKLNNETIKENNPKRTGGLKFGKLLK